MGSSDLVSGIESQFLFGKATPSQSYTYERVMKIHSCSDPYRVLFISVGSTAKVLNTNVKGCYKQSVKAGLIVVRNKRRWNEESPESARSIYNIIDENYIYIYLYKFVFEEMYL